uniref:F-box domain-containing protein n=1 Tax=Tetraselmis sp. GSL018 TaxID=582737 RepID=A0A061QQU9_9CHLO|mmetsp:Transcript_41894/g.99417  ORF Transcript_41894/g.99417 Transcript_41894/m.99417 type:complete len:518 (+) Transcript_41894:199-1752(+)
MERAPSRSDVSGMLQQTPLLCIPPECLLYVSCFLEEGMDVEALEQTCKGCLKVLRSSKAWQHRISSEFGLDLAASGRVPDGCSALGAPSVVSQLKQVYKQLKAQKAPTDVRFRGCFTDGGCDGGQMRYWVDNMFVPNHWESHCTDAGSDVACIGVLLEIDEPAAQEAAQHRQYLIERCRIASDRLFEMPIDLNTWTTAELEHFFQELYTELQQRNAVGALLIHGVPDPREEMAKLELAMQRLEQRQRSLNSIVGYRAQGDGPRGSRLKMLDERIVPLVSDPCQCNRAAVLEHVCISRAGHFSCPVSCGAVAVGDFRASDDMDLAARMEAIAASDCSTALNGVRTRADVEAAVAVGRLPPIASSGSSESGEWVEFSPLSSWRHAPAALETVLWFRFCPFAEMRRREHGDEPRAAASAGASGRSSPTPSASPQNSESGASDTDEGEPILSQLVESTDAKNSMQIPLRFRRCTNMALVKLIWHEDLRQEWEDDHPEPNIDINYVQFLGRSAEIGDLRLRL